LDAKVPFCITFLDAAKSLFLTVTMLQELAWIIARLSEKRANSVLSAQEKCGGTVFHDAARVLGFAIANGIWFTVIFVLGY